MEGLNEFIDYRDSFLAKFRDYIGVSKFDYSEVVTDKKVRFHRNGVNKKKTDGIIPNRPNLSRYILFYIY